MADSQQAQRIWAALARSTSSGKADTFTRWAFAPRSNTVRNDSWWDWVFRYYFGINGSFDGQVEDGGAALYVSYYDVMARLQSRGVDDAYSRFAQVIDRYAKPDHLAGGSPLYYGEIQQHINPGEVATDTPFPEAGLPAVSFLNGFLGIQAAGDALRIDPHLPQRGGTVDQAVYRPSVTGQLATGSHTYGALPWAGIRHLTYRGSMLDITESYRDSAVDRVTADVTPGTKGSQWPITLSVGGFGPDAVVTGAAGRWNSDSGLWSLVVGGPGRVVISRPETAEPTVAEVPYPVLLGLTAVILAGAGVRRARRRQHPRMWELRD